METLGDLHCCSYQSLSLLPDTAAEKDPRPEDRLLQWKRKWGQPGSVENMLPNILWAQAPTCVLSKSNISNLDGIVFLSYVLFLVGRSAIKKKIPWKFLFFCNDNLIKLVPSKFSYHFILP